MELGTEFAPIGAKAGEAGALAVDVSRNSYIHFSFTYVVVERVKFLLLLKVLRSLYILKIAVGCFVFFTDAGESTWYDSLNAIACLASDPFNKEPRPNIDN